MRADYIKKIIKSYEKSPYKCILIDGAWGIGKSYAIKNALHASGNVCSISMFGMKDAQEIYHEVFFQLVSTGKKALSNVIPKALDFITEVSSEVDAAKGILRSLVKEKELFFHIAKNFKKYRYIVIDDLERMNNDIKLEEVFGIIDELKNSNYVKVILVANVSEIIQKVCFDKYREKVIDRIYQVTEIPADVEWPELGIHDAFIMDFLKKHEVKNLRTLQKAQNLYDDFILQIEKHFKEEFYEEIRLACFAIVVESIDKLYYKEPDESIKDEIHKIAIEGNNKTDARILNYYLRGTRISNSMFYMIFNYYNNEIEIEPEEIESEYQIFIHAGEKANFYKSDDEIKRMLPNLAEKIRKESNISKMLKYADEYFIWSEHIELDTTDLKKDYQSKLHDLIYKEVLNGKTEYITYGIDTFYLQAETNKKILKDINERIKYEVLNEYVQYLKDNTQGELAYEYSYRLRGFADNTYFRNVIINNIDVLYNEKSFPIYDVTEQQYRTSYNIMYVMYYENEEKFLNYCRELQKTCDNMATHRINVLVEQITGKKLQ